MRSPAKIFERFWRLILLLVLLLAIPSIAAGAPAELTAEELAWIAEHPQVRLAPDPDFPPIEYFDKDGRYHGIAAEFIMLLQSKLPIKLEIVQMDNWSEVIQAAKDRRIDMFGAAVPTPERLEYMLFTKPFVEFPSVVLVRDDVQESPKLKDLKGKRVAVVANYADHEYMKRAHPEISLEVMPDISSGIRLVSFGKVDAMILNIASASYYIAKDGITNIKVSEDTGFIFDLSLACRSDWPILQSILEKGLAAISPEERKTVYNNWISLGNASWRPSPTLIVCVVAVIMLLGLAVVLQWNRTLKKQIQQRTAELHIELEERLQAEREKQKLQEQIERSKKMEALGLLAGGVAHDLNNILVGVSGYAELMLMKVPPDSPVRKYAETIRDSGKRAAAVVADMLTISRNAATDKKPLNLNQLVKRYLASPEQAELAKRFPRVDFSASLSNDLFNVACSDSHIYKALMNLAVNAAEATEQGHVLIRTRNCYIDRPFGLYEQVKIGEYVRLEVCDNGPGIAEQDLEHLFEPFFTRKKIGHSGTGLGLAVVWNTVHDHGGYIEIEQSEQGSCFVIYLPITRNSTELEEAVEKNELPRGHGERILVVDNEPHIRELAAQILEALGYRVDIVASGEDAIEYLRKQSVNLLVLDMIMDPGINGCETYLQAVVMQPGIKAVICSGFSESMEVKRAQAAGAGDYLKKPYSIRDLAKRVHEELKRN